MNITKYIHSCLLIEDQGKTVLIDPGEYSVGEKALDLSGLTQLDYLLVTHEHADHMDKGFIKEVVNKFPRISVLSNESVAEILSADGLRVETTGDEKIKMEAVPHEVIMGHSPKNVLFRILDKLTHPGDSFHFDVTTEVLALPLQAPWGSTEQAINLALKLKPKVILPIHDWHWRDEARVAMYQRLEDYFENLGMRFLSLETGQTVEV